MKNIIIILFASLLHCAGAIAQHDFRLLSGNQEIIQKAIDSAIVIVRQDYVLQSTNNPALTFGRGDNPFFGRKYAIAVLSENHLLFDISLKTPWFDDPNYTEYRGSDTLKPILKEAWAKPIYGNTYIQIVTDTSLLTCQIDSVFKSNGIGICPSPFTATGLKIKPMDSDREGWLVLGSSETDLSDNDTLPVKVTIYREKPEYNPTERAGKIKSPAQPAKILGGFFVFPEYRMGTVQFYMSGIFIKKILNYYVAAIPERQTLAPKTQDIVPLKPIQN